MVSHWRILTTWSFRAPIHFFGDSSLSLTCPSTRAAAEPHPRFMSPDDNNITDNGSPRASDAYRSDGSR
ncbi:hypothetical protein ACRE_088760 [Hapsidospora chrysogenum ATCC 11550]|uniref:Uncharacterized protein n=1 Tax=Hapsidospora chrysogenum (strain ATCC 11550 / CBS 779.69 / DSM 880 / IAM 14645 / JCM 23072 / IMI 49137) TaxID=857340 RepID=A0A086STM9_HAPC1|nr:hypothetical protein ACRE_088760 [Hapsidospora chrysogenum ATCC 11550]